LGHEYGLVSVFKKKFAHIGYGRVVGW